MRSRVLGAPVVTNFATEVRSIFGKQICDTYHYFAGHMHLPALLSGLCHSELEVLLASMSRFYKKHLKSFGDSMVTAFMSGNYTKVS